MPDRFPVDPCAPASPLPALVDEPETLGEFLAAQRKHVKWGYRIAPWGRFTWGVTLTNGLLEKDPYVVWGSRDRAEKFAERQLRKDIAQAARTRAESIERTVEA